MNRSILRSLISLFCAILLCITVTFSWMLSNETPIGKNVELAFTPESGHTLRIAANSIDVEFLVVDPVTQQYVATDESPTLSGMVPNESIPFRIRFRNTSGESQTVKILMTDITTDNTDILPYMYVGMSGGKGYTTGVALNTEVPDKIFYCLTDATNRGGYYELQLYSVVEIPATGESNYVELNGYFWFHRDATTALSNISLTIGKFRIIL